MRLIDSEKIQLNKKGIYEDVRRDIQRTQTLHSSKNLSGGGNPLEVAPMSKKRNHDANDHYYHEISNSARMPTHNYQVHCTSEKSFRKPQHRARLQSPEDQAKD